MRHQSRWLVVSVLMGWVVVFPASSQAQFYKDPFGDFGKISPSASKQWRPDGSLPSLDLPNLSAREGLPQDHELSLPELTEYALEHNPATSQAWYAARAAAAVVGVAQAGRMPTISGIYTAGRARSASSTSGVIGNWLDRWGPSVSLSYVLYDFGLVKSQIQSAEYRLLAANLSQNRVLQQVISQVELSYYQLTGLSAIVGVNQQAVKNNQTALDAVSRRHESGLATEADVLRAQTLVDQSQLNLQRSRGDMEKSRGQLSSIVGIPVNSAIKLAGLNPPPESKEAVQAIGQFLETVKISRPDLAASEAQVRAAKATADAAFKSTLPSIQLTGGYAYTSWSSKEYFSNPGTCNSTPPSTTAANYLCPHTVSPSIAINVLIPIFSGFKDTYNVRQAREAVSQAEMVRDQLYNQSQLDVWQSYHDLQTSKESMGSAESVVRSSSRTAEATLARYKEGYGTILELITAQQDEVTARTQRIQSYLDWYSALTRLHLAVGSSALITTNNQR